MSEIAGYVVVEYNQASHQAGIPFGADIHADEDDAAGDKEQYERFASAAGRRERYVIGTIYIEED